MDRESIDRETLGNTLPKLLHQRCQQWGEKRVALRQKEFGIWREYTWNDCYEKTKFIALGLASLGLKHGDIIFILGLSSPEWLWCELGVQAAGGMVAGISPVAGTDQVKNMLTSTPIEVVFVQDQEQVDKIMEISSDLPSLKKIVYWHEKGLRHYDDSLLLSLTDLVNLGESYEKSQAGVFEHRLSEGKETDVAVILSGPLGANGELRSWPATQGFLISSVQAALARHPVQAGDEYVSSASPSWFFEQVLGFGVSLFTGQRLNFAERADTAAMDFREISPQIVMYPSTTWEMMGQGIKKNMEGGSRLKRVLYNLSLSSNQKCTDTGKNVHRIGLLNPIVNRVIRLFLVRPLRDKHGLSRARVAYAAGGRLSQEISGLFCALLIDVEPVYGSSKDGIATSLPPQEIRIE